MISEKNDLDEGSSSCSNSGGVSVFYSHHSELVVCSYV